MPTPLTPEQEARRLIDQMLEDAGWQVQSRERMNRTAALGVAICEFPTETGPVDYLLFAGGRPIGVVEDLEAAMEQFRVIAEDLGQGCRTWWGRRRGAACCAPLPRWMLQQEVHIECS